MAKLLVHAVASRRTQRTVMVQSNHLRVGLLLIVPTAACAALFFRRARLRRRAATKPDCSYVVPRTGETFPLSKPRWCGSNGEALMLTKLPGISRTLIDTSKRSLWRYAASFPVTCNSPISLGEGCTPLVARPFAGSESVHFKCEWNNPTCSFKDRGTSVMLSLLRQQGITHVLEDSSGNGGASVACYAAAGGLHATIMAPSSTSPAKTVQMHAHGATVELVPGSRQDTADAAVAAHGRDGGKLFYASHNWHPFFLQGTKTLAYELWEDLGFRAPDAVIIPTGAGSNILGCDIGFSELLSSGEIDRVPRIYCAQPLLCSPIATGILDALGEDDGQTAPEVWNVPVRTSAEGASIAQPVRLDECIGAVVRSGGGAVRVSEADIVAATRDLAALGLYTEPTCAQAAAAYRTLLARGEISAGDVAVVVLTSTGVKATPGIAKLLGLQG
jgi:threonine synthase